MLDPDPPPRVCAVVVTYNRLALLRRCLAALEGQTRPVDAVLVIDNASTDGTAEAVRREHPGVELMALAENTGGAGGFHTGMRHAYAQGFDWLWLMDDDTMVAPEALAALLAADDAVAPRRPSLLASRVEWRDGTLHPMNIARPRLDAAVEAIDVAPLGILPIRVASFVSLLVRREAIAEHGLPHPDWFIYSEDAEYTARVLRRGCGYLVPTSVARHETATARQSYDTSGERFYYDVRNTLLMLRGDAWAPHEKPRLVRDLVHNMREHVRRRRFERQAVTNVLRGLRDGALSPVPTPQRP